MPALGVGFAVMHMKEVVAPDCGGCPGHAGLESLVEVHQRSRKGKRVTRSRGSCNWYVFRGIMMYLRYIFESVKCYFPPWRSRLFVGKKQLVEWDDRVMNGGGLQLRVRFF